MKQIIQNLKSGETILEDVPAPQVKSGCVLIQTTRSLVSLGTERMLVEFGQANLIAKARQQPEKVKMVLDKIKSDGLIPTLEAVFTKLGTPLPLGYCNVGKVVALGKGVTEFKVGDRVASNGQHAEFVCVPKNLVAAIPEGVSDDEAAFAVIGSIGLQGMRLLQPMFGETVVVVGLGLIGLITAELLKANGCRVIGFDFDTQKVDLARAKGIDAVNPGAGTDQVGYVLGKTDGIGCDGVIITASTKSDEVISQSARMCRQRGRIVLVGVVGLNINRSDFYNKELTFQVSCSYGPGRYDEAYEAKGQDYPIGFVRWTEKRNFEAVLAAIARQQLDVKSLITEKIPLDAFGQIYGDMRKAGSIASILCYSEDSVATSTIRISESSAYRGQRNGIGIIGAGNFTGATVLPAFKHLSANIKYIASASGLSAATLAKRAGSTHATSDYREILKDEEVDLVIITTRHDLHARMVVEALKAGKHVFVEKPLCLNEGELGEILECGDPAPLWLPRPGSAMEEQAGTCMGEENKNKEFLPDVRAPGRTEQSGAGSPHSKPSLTVGFNRRFAPLAVKMKALLGEGPKNIIATMNAGSIPPSVWVHDLEVGGGRIIGEACHYIDLCTFLAGSAVTAVCMNAMGVKPQENTDNASILLKYANGTNAVINYFANGSKSYSKERVEVYAQEKTLVMDNWRELRGYGVPGFSKLTTKQDKGHKAQFALLVERVNKGGAPLIPLAEIVNTTRASFSAIASLKSGRWVEVE